MGFARIVERTRCTEHPVSIPVLGTCVIKNSDGRRVSLSPRKVTVHGVQHGFIVDFQISQEFQHDQERPQDVFYIVPNNMKMCVYDTVFTIGTEVIHPEIQEKEEAKKIYEEAKQQGRAAIMTENLGNGLIEFKIGNIPAETVCKVDIKCGVIASSSNLKQAFVKFPLDVCTQSGSTHCVTSDLTGEFVFDFVDSDPSRVSKITSNVAGRYENGRWEISEKPNTGAILLTTVFNSECVSEKSVSGKTMAITVCWNDEDQEDTLKNGEFVFIVDCSGSMSGSRISNVRTCLGIFLKSLPTDCYFNIVRFGSKYEMLFPDSAAYTEENVARAESYVSEMNANLGGTNIYNPLNMIFQMPRKGSGSRQIFVLTDGEVNNTEAVLTCVEQNNALNRCFALGLGRGADAGLVEGIADHSGGSSSFVEDGEDMSGKVITQLQNSLKPSLCDISVHIEGCDNLEISPFPIRSIPTRSSSTIMVRSENDFSGSEPVLLSGLYNGEQRDLIVERVGDPADSIGALFAFASMQCIERNMNLGGRNAEDMKQRLVSLSKASGVLCRYTSFVGSSEQTWVEPPMQVLCGAQPTGVRGFRLMASSGVQRRSARVTEDVAYCLAPKASAEAECGIMSFGAMENGAKRNKRKEKQKRQERQERYAASELTCDAIIRLQGIQGSWKCLSDLQMLLGKPVVRPQAISGENDEVFATVLALAVLRNSFPEKEASWSLVAKKAMKWLRGINDSYDWDVIINDIVGATI